MDWLSNNWIWVLAGLVLLLLVYLWGRSHRLLVVQHEHYHPTHANALYAQHLTLPANKAARDGSHGLPVLEVDRGLGGNRQRRGWDAIMTKRTGKRSLWA